MPKKKTEPVRIMYVAPAMDRIADFLKELTENYRLGKRFDKSLIGERLSGIEWEEIRSEVRQIYLRRVKSLVKLYTAGNAPITEELFNTFLWDLERLTESIDLILSYMSEDGVDILVKKTNLRALAKEVFTGDSE